MLGPHQPFLVSVCPFIQSASILSRVAGAQAKVVKYIAPEETWLRLLARELRPVLAYLQVDAIPDGGIPTPLHHF